MIQGFRIGAGVCSNDGLSFPEALLATRTGNVFTTHTPVSAGFDAFPPSVIARYLPGDRGSDDSLQAPMATPSSFPRPKVTPAAARPSAS
jgi:glucan phosphorylase